MAGDKDIHNDPKHNTNGFKQNPQNIGKGRPKKIYTVIKEMGYNADDIKTAFGELAFYTLPELEKLSKDDSKPVITRIVANQFFTALKKSDWNKIKEILEHVIGKPIQPTDITTGGEKISEIVVMSQESKDELQKLRNDND